MVIALSKADAMLTLSALYNTGSSLAFFRTKCVNIT